MLYLAELAVSVTLHMKNCKEKYHLCHCRHTTCRKSNNNLVDCRSSGLFLSSNHFSTCPLLHVVFLQCQCNWVALERGAVVGHLKKKLVALMWRSYWGRKSGLWVWTLGISRHLYIGLVFCYSDSILFPCWVNWTSCEIIYWSVTWESATQVQWDWHYSY